MQVIFGDRDESASIYNGVFGELHLSKKEFYSDLRRKVILDVGCGTGVAARFLIKQDNTVYGVTLSEDEAAICRGVMMDVMVADLDELREPPFRPVKFDVVILGDVLEHLKYPYTMLLLADKALNDDGLLFVSVPNVANVLVRLSLLLGNFRYTEFGIIDKTHLRFFTIESIRYMLSAAGFGISDHMYSNWNWRLVPNCLYKVRGVRRLELILKRVLTNILPGLFATQIMLVARPAGRSVRGE